MATTLIFLGVVAAVVWSVVIREDRGLLTISFLPAGKTSIVVIEAPSGRTVLIDGGSGAHVLRAVGSVFPWYRRSVDVVVVAHPDTTYVSGLVDIFKRYHVERVVRSGASGSGPVWIAFEQSLQNIQKDTSVLIAQRGQVIDLGGGAYIEILFPDRNLALASSGEACVEMQLVYKATSFMLSCGVPSVQEYLVLLDGNGLQSHVLSADNGSGTSSPLFAGFVAASINARSGTRLVSDGVTIREI